MQKFYLAKVKLPYYVRISLTVHLLPAANTYFILQHCLMLVDNDEAVTRDRRVITFIWYVTLRSTKMLCGVQE